MSNMRCSPLPWPCASESYSRRVVVNLPEAPPGGYRFRLQDVEKQRERRKTKAKKKGRKKKEEKLGNMKTPTNFCGFFWPFLL